MKKLMIAAAIVCAATFANAAACAWSTYAYDSGMTAALTGGQYWLVSLGTSATGLDSLKVYNDGTVDFGTYQTIASGKITDDTGAVSGQLTGLTSANNGNYYAIVVMEEDKTYFGKASGVISGIVDEPPADANPIVFDNTGLSYGMMLADTETFKKEDPPITPEPTSAMLMLLGMAGLALRRKQK